MDPKQKQILKKKRDFISKTVSLDEIRPLLKAYKIFNKYMWQDIHSMSDVFDLLPTRGPKAFQSIILILRKANYTTEADSLEDSYIPDLIYKMSSQPRGYCLLINNVKFELPDLKERLGSDVDAQSLQAFLEKIHYKVEPEANLKAFEMLKRLKDFAKSNFKAVDSSIVIILSHGGQDKNKDIIYGTDGEHIYKQEIIELFNNKNCSQLQGKPKVFFFVACRGNSKDYGAPKLPSKSSESADSVEIPLVMPTTTDALVVHSSLPYHISLRDDDLGSWFCQDLVSVLEEYHHKYDLEDMIKIVNIKLMKRVSHFYRVTQAAHSENYGFKKLFFCENLSSV